MQHTVEGVEAENAGLKKSQNAMQQTMSCSDSSDLARIGSSLQDDINGGTFILKD